MRCSSYLGFTVLAFAFAVGCGESYTVDDYWRELAAMHCRRMRGCCTPAEFEDWWTGENGRQDCETVWQNAPRTYDIRKALDAGRMDFSPGAARACIATLDVLDCRSFEPAYRYHETYCESLPLRGLVTDGSRCEFDDECASTRCFVDPGDPQHQGVCKPTIAHGGTCEAGRGCARPEACQNDGTCGLGLPAGARCSSDFDCIDHWCKGGGLFRTGTCIRACDG